MKKTIGTIAIAAMCCLVCLPGCKKVPPLVNTYADGLMRATPETQGVHTEGILRFLEEVDANGVELHSFMLIRHGKVLAEGWWYPYRSSYNHLMHSVSKTFTATAVGFAVDEKLLTVDDKVISFFPGDLPAEVSSNLEKLTVKHLLTMTAGHASAPEFYVQDDNWVKRYLAVPIVHEPGTVFQYSSYASYMLSAIVQKVTGQTAFDYLTPRLFEPLGISDIQWETNREGINTGGWGMRIKTADLAKLGMFYLQKGKWDGQQLLSEGWFNEATSPQIYQRPDRTAEQNAGDDWAQGYGYQLWVCTNDAYRIDGAYGQFAVVIPGQDAVVAFTARATDTQRELKLIWENLLPAMAEKAIPTDLIQNDVLRSALAGLKLPDPFRTDEELALPKGETRSYTMAANDRGITGVDFRFGEDAGCTLTLHKDGKTYELPFGLDAWVYGKTDRLSPYFASPRRNPEGLLPLDIAGYGSWTTANELCLRLLYVTDFQDESFICTFNGDNVSIDLSNSMEQGKAPVRLTGKAGS